MSKMKELILDHRGYTISGVVEVEYWGGTTGWLPMDVSFIPSHELTHNEIKRRVNDGGFGCKNILGAEVTISDTYGDQHVEVINRVVTLNSKQCFYGTRGIKRKPAVY